MYIFISMMLLFFTSWSNVFSSNNALICFKSMSFIQEHNYPWISFFALPHCHKIVIKYSGAAYGWRALFYCSWWKNITNFAPSQKKKMAEKGSKLQPGAHWGTANCYLRERESSGVDGNDAGGSEEAFSPPHFPPSHYSHPPHTDTP